MHPDEKLMVTCDNICRAAQMRKTFNKWLSVIDFHVLSFYVIFSTACGQARIQGVA